MLPRTLFTLTLGFTWLLTPAAGYAQGRGGGPDRGAGRGQAAPARPQQSRPAQSYQRPTSQPSFARPHNPAASQAPRTYYRPPAAAQWPAITQRPNIPQRQATGAPATARPANRQPGMARLPGWGGTVQRPAVINRPGNDNRPNIVNRPGVDNRGGIIRQPTIDRSRTVNQTNRINQNTTINQNNINRTRINNRQTVIRNQFLNNITVNRPTVHRHVENWTGRWDRYQSRWHPWYRSWHSHWHPYRSWGVPAVWAGGLWGLGSLYYTSGYYPYYNPYYVSTAFVTAVPTTNYALPLSVQVLDEPPQVAIQTFDAARLAFRNGDYPRALQMVNDALRDTPNDPALHEFRALTFFAMGRYQEASATLYAVLSVSSGWDWPTLYGLYPDLQTYEVQLRALERFRDANPNAAYARFYLAYLDKIGGYTEAAIAELRNVMTLQPQDQVAASMLASLQGEQGQTRQASEPVPPPEPPQELVPAPEDTSMAPARDSLVGSWIARRAGDNAPIRLTLTADNKFSWTFSQQERITNLEGTFSYDGGVLFLEQKDGAAMMGKLTARANGFNFKMVNAPANDPGLEFIRQ